MAEVSPFARQASRSRIRARPMLSDGPLDTHTRRLPGGVVVVSVAGEIDMANVVTLRAELAPHLTDTKVRLLVCDLSEVTFLSCSGLSVLLDARTALAARDAGTRVVAGDPAVLRTLTVTGLLRALSVTSDVATALA